MHFQTSVDNWDKALILMPDYTLLKSVNDPGLLLDGYNKWVAAGRDPNKLFLDHRHHDFYYPDFDGADKDKTFEEYKEIWRSNFARTIDGTYYEKYAPFIKLIEELNEYTDTRMVTNKALLAPRIRSATAAVSVWNGEYRGHDGIPDDARLVICNSPVGNDIPIEFFQLCRDEDAVLGVRTYTHWINKQRDLGDFRWHSGRPFFNEVEYGIRVDYVLGESGPYAGVLEGWRHENVMGGDRDLLIQGMRAWWQDLATTNAYKEGRILGPGAWFTSSRSDDQWDYYRLWESELMPLAEAAAELWKPGSQELPVVPPDSEVPYKVIANLLHQEATKPQKLYVVDQVHDSRQTILQSADDAARLVAPGQPGSKVKSWGSEYWKDDIEVWLREHGVKIVEHWHYPDVLELWHYPLPQRSELTTTDRFTFPHEPFDRDYNGDGYYDHRHEGIDLAAILNEPIAAMRDGKVVWSSNKRRSNPDEDSKYGEHIVIEHEGGYTSWYAHLNNRTIFEGTVCAGGQLIGQAGTTGFSDGVHLHLSIQHYGYGYRYTQGYVLDWVIDPQPILEEVLNRE